MCEKRDAAEKMLVEAKTCDGRTLLLRRDMYRKMTCECEGWLCRKEVKVLRRLYEQYCEGWEERVKEGVPERRCISEVMRVRDSVAGMNGGKKDDLLKKRIRELVVKMRDAVWDGDSNVVSNVSSDSDTASEDVDERIAPYIKELYERLKMCIRGGVDVKQFLVFAKRIKIQLLRHERHGAKKFDELVDAIQTSYEDEEFRADVLDERSVLEKAACDVDDDDIEEKARLETVEEECETSEEDEEDDDMWEEIIREDQDGDDIGMEDNDIVEEQWEEEEISQAEIDKIVRMRARNRKEGVRGVFEGLWRR